MKKNIQKNVGRIKKKCLILLIGIYYNEGKTMHIFLGSERFGF